MCRGDGEIEPKQMVICTLGFYAMLPTGLRDSGLTVSSLKPDLRTNSIVAFGRLVEGRLEPERSSPPASRAVEPCRPDEMDVGVTRWKKKGECQSMRFNLQIFLELESA